MSLEEKLSALTLAIEGLTDSNQHLASTMRQCFTGPGSQINKTAVTEPAPAPTEPVQEVKRGRGRPPKEAPAAPLEQAATARTAEPAIAVEPTVSGATTPDGTYADLAQLVPAVAEKHGRSKAVALFATLGVANGKELQEKHPKLIPAAVALFRAALGD